MNERIGRRPLGLASAPPTSGGSRPLELVVLAVVSACAIALQISLIRALSIASHHHFVYLVVSTALLGFGAGGTILAVFRSWCDRHYHLVTVASLAVLALAHWSLRAAVAVPVDLYYLLYDLRQAGRLWLATLLLSVPFLAAGLFIGSVLRRYGDRAGPTYAANLLGSVHHHVQHGRAALRGV